MKLILKRIDDNENETLGIMSLDGVKLSFTLEDQRQNVKIYGETRIPAGTYKIELRTQGRLHEKYKNRFPDLHQGMLHITHIPNFEYVYIHIGNTHIDTLGCPLVGKKAVIRGNNITLEESTVAYKHLYGIVIDEAKNNNLYIRIVDN